MISIDHINARKTRAAVDCALRTWFISLGNFLLSIKCIESVSVGMRSVSVFKN